jgi:hypothetical protein
MVTRPAGITPITNEGFARYTAALIAGVLVVQEYTALAADGQITAGTGLLLAGVALYVVVFSVRNATALRQRAFGTYFAHVLAYLIINGSFWVHAWILIFSGRGEILQQGWSGPLVSMSVLWGAGLLVHTIGAVLGRGYEHVDV